MLTDNATNMNGLFYKCSSLAILPDISNWNIENFKNIGHMFKEWSSCSKLPDIVHLNYFFTKF